MSDGQDQIKNEEGEQQSEIGFQTAAEVKQLAGQRWLKNKEVLDVLQRFQELGLESSPEVQSQPQSGQLLLYDRAVVKYFRRDQHEWKKKSKGKAVREDHEKLKIDSVERLTCCYAHSEETPTFHRRIYWLISSPTNATGTGEGVGATGVATPDISPADCHAVRGAEGVEKTGGVKLPPKRNVSKCDEESATGGDGAENSSCSSFVLVHYLDERNIVCKGDASEPARGQRNSSQKRGKSSSICARKCTAPQRAHRPLSHSLSDTMACATNVLMHQQQQQPQAQQQDSQHAHADVAHAHMLRQLQQPHMLQQLQHARPLSYPPIGNSMAGPVDASTTRELDDAVHGGGRTAQSEEPSPGGPVGLTHMASWQHLVHQVNGGDGGGLRQPYPLWQSLADKARYQAAHQEGLHSPYPQWQNLAAKAQEAFNQNHNFFHHSASAASGFAAAAGAAGGGGVWHGGSLYPQWEHLTEKMTALRGERERSEKERQEKERRERGRQEREREDDLDESTFAFVSTNPQSEEHNLKVLPAAAGQEAGAFAVDYGSPQRINIYKKVEMKVEEGATCQEGATCHLLDVEGGMESVDLYDQSIGMDLECSLGDGLIIDGGGGGGSWRESTPPTYQHTSDEPQGHSPSGPVPVGLSLQECADVPLDFGASECQMYDGRMDHISVPISKGLEGWGGAFDGPGLTGSDRDSHGHPHDDYGHLNQNLMPLERCELSQGQTASDAMQF